ncbi:MAG: hypothetical protein K2P78_13510 [Gemmataceae bacterium]|nr:hypothetical protein [Gemmataceae bacterium]
MEPVAKTVSTGHPGSTASPGSGMSAKVGTRHGSKSPARSASHGPAGGNTTRCGAK